MGLTTFNGDYPLLEDAVIAKNYLSKEELDVLNRIVTLYLDFAELQALEQHPMTMDDWVKELDYFLKMTRKDILNGSGLVSHQEALEQSEEATCTKIVQVQNEGGRAVKRERPVYPSEESDGTTFFVERSACKRRNKYAPPP